MKSILQKLSKVIIAPNDFIFLPKHDLQYPKISHIPLLPWQCVLMPPTLSFPCSCLHASIVTCIKLVLTVRGNFFKNGDQWATVMIDIPEKISDKTKSQKNCLNVPSSRFPSHALCSYPYAPIPMLLSRCFHHDMFKIGTHSKWNSFFTNDNSDD